MEAEPPRDPLFEDVERWREELDDGFARQLFVIVTAGAVSLFVVMMLMLLLNGCTDAVERPPPTLPAIAVTTTLPNHITVPTTTSTTLPL